MSLQQIEATAAFKVLSWRFPVAETRLASILLNLYRRILAVSYFSLWFRHMQGSPVGSCLRGAYVATQWIFRNNDALENAAWVTSCFVCKLRVRMFRKGELTLISTKRSAPDRRSHRLAGAASCGPPQGPGSQCRHSSRVVQIPAILFALSKLYPFSPPPPSSPHLLPFPARCAATTSRWQSQRQRIISLSSRFQSQ